MGKMTRRELRGAAAFACLLLFILAIMALARYSNDPRDGATSSESIKNEIPSGDTRRDSVDSAQQRDSVLSAKKPGKRAKKPRKSKEVAPVKDLDSPLSRPI